MQNDATPHTANSKDGQAAAFYVATDGNDAWSGTLAAPNADRTDGPFATLVRARDAVRELKAQAKGELTDPIAIMVRGGKYFLAQTLDLMAADGGTPEAPITYVAYPGETPILSGGKRMTGWKPHEGKILKCEVPEARGGAWTFRQLFLDGQRQIRARYPNLDPEAEHWNGTWAMSEPDDGALETSSPYIVWKEPGAFPHDWAKPGQGELFLMPREPLWGDSCMIRVESIDKDRGIIRLAHGMRDFDTCPMYYPREERHPERCRFVVENLLEELDRPGEWCLDSEEGVLYFWPPEDSVADKEVVAPALKCLVHLRGVANVRISGFVFTETRGGEPSSHYSDVDGVGAMRPQMGWEYCGEAIYLNMCTNCCIENSKISGVGGNGIYMRHHNERNVIRANEISHAGANGIVLAGGRHSIYQSTGGTQGIPHPVFNEVTDNEIHHCGLYDTYAAGVFLGLSNWNIIAHNEIHDVPHHGINLGNSRYGRSYIEHNRLDRTCQVTSDNGAINCWNEVPVEDESPGHVIRHNLIVDTGNPHSGVTMGIYLDNWTSQCLVYGNIIVNTIAGGHGNCVLVKGKNNILENNILVNSGYTHIWVMPHCCYPEFATVISRNIFYDTLGGDGPFLDLANQLHLYKVVMHCDGNLFFKRGEDNPLIARGSWRHETGEHNPRLAEGIRFSEWPRMYGGDEDVYDVHSVVADPLFVDAANGDYRLKPESPALKLGFQPIDISNIGIRKKGPQKPPNKELNSDAASRAR